MKCEGFSAEENPFARPGKNVWAGSAAGKMKAELLGCEDAVKISVGQKKWFVLYYESRGFRYRARMLSCETGPVSGTKRKSLVYYGEGVGKCTKIRFMHIKEEEVRGEKKGIDFLSEKEKTGFQNHQRYI